jgi:hypothetical protein
METNTAPVVLRNGVNWSLTDDVFGKKSPKVGTHFWKPVATESNWQEFCTWFGISELVAAVNVISRRIFADILLDHLEENEGVINEAELMAEYAEFSAGRESLSAIEDQLDDLQAKQREIVTNPALDLNEAGIPVTAEAVALLQQIKAINSQIVPLKERKAEIEAEYAKRAAKRAATKAAKKAAAGK